MRYKSQRLTELVGGIVLRPYVPHGMKKIGEGEVFRSDSNSIPNQKTNYGLNSCGQRTFPVMHDALNSSQLLASLMMTITATIVMQLTS